MQRRYLACTAIAAAGLLIVGTAPSVLARPHRVPAAHVLLLSVDGLHGSDLAYYVRTHPDSGLARLVSDGTAYTHAQTTFPSDSFPGMVAQVTGAGPGTSGM